MRFLRSSLVALFLVLGFAASAYAGGFQLNEHGARAMAQAGAFAARATDASAIYFNPAGLGFQTDPSAYVGTTAIMFATSFYGPLQNNTNNETKLVSQIFTPINAYVAYPVTDQIHVGFGVNNPFGLGTEWPENWTGKFLTTKIDLQTFFFSPTVAYKLTDQLSLGAGVSYATGTVTLQRAVATGFGDPSLKLDMSGHGWGWFAGALYKFTPELSVGLSYRSKVTIDASGTAAFTPAYSVLPNGDAAASLSLPATGYAGVAYKLLENLEVEADYQYIGWSSYSELAITFKATNSTSASPKNYQDTYIMRIGGEYTIDKLHLRGGYYYDHSPVKTEYSEPLLPDANRNGINLGLGYELTPHLSVDIAYLLILFEDRKAVNTVPEINFDGTYKSTANLVGLNFGYKF